MLRKYLIAVPVLAVFLSVSGLAAHADTVIYNTVPSPLPGNVTSLGYQATQTAEFGNHIQFGPGGRQLTSATVTMSNWAKLSDYSGADPAGWSHPLTLNLYNVDNSGTVPQTGSLIFSTTIDAAIPWHLGVDGGTAFNVTFDLPNVDVPDEIIFGLAYNTQTWGESPIGSPGPYNSLNFGVSTTSPTVGVDVDSDAVFWNTSNAGWYTDGGAAGVGIFRQDTNWSPYTPAISFSAAPVPEPSSLSLFALTTMAGGFYQWRRKKRQAPV